MGTGDEIDTGGHHGGRVDQRRNRGRARHRVRQPGLQRQLCRFADGAAKQHQTGKRQGREPSANISGARTSNS